MWVAGQVVLGGWVHWVVRVGVLVRACVAEWVGTWVGGCMGGCVGWLGWF